VLENCLTPPTLSERRFTANSTRMPQIVMGVYPRFRSRFRFGFRNNYQSSKQLNSESTAHCGKGAEGDMSYALEWSFVLRFSAQPKTDRSRGKKNKVP
jgi:hypothetical protein